MGNLLQRSTIKKMNEKQLYPFFDFSSLNDEIKRASSDLIENLNTLKGQFDFFIFGAAGFDNQSPIINCRKM